MVLVLILILHCISTGTIPYQCYFNEKDSKSSEIKMLGNFCKYIQDAFPHSVFLSPFSHFLFCLSNLQKETAVVFVPFLSSRFRGELQF